MHALYYYVCCVSVFACDRCLTFESGFDVCAVLVGMQSELLCCSSWMCTIVCIRARAQWLPHCVQLGCPWRCYCSWLAGQFFYLIEPPSSSMLVSNIQLCTSWCKHPHGVFAHGSFEQIRCTGRSYRTWLIVVVCPDLRQDFQSALRAGSRKHL